MFSLNLLWNYIQYVNIFTQTFLYTTTTHKYNLEVEFKSALEILIFFLHMLHIVTA